MDAVVVVGDVTGYDVNVVSVPGDTNFNTKPVIVDM